MSNFEEHFEGILEWTNFKEHFGPFQNRLFFFYTKLILCFFNNRHRCVNFETDNPNKHFRVQMLSKWAQNAVQNALKMLFGKTDFKMHAFQNGKI